MGRSVFSKEEDEKNTRNKLIVQFITVVPLAPRTVVIQNSFSKIGSAMPPVPVAVSHGIYAFIQGASRGIGLQFCRYLLESESHPVKLVIAACRQPEEALVLQSLKKNYPNNLELIQLDVTEEDQIASVSSRVGQLVGVEGGSGGLDLLVNCAGMLHPSGRGETSLKAVSKEGLAVTFATNTFGPLLMAKHFAGLLSQGRGGFGRASAGLHAGILVNVSARVGSIADNGLGGWYSYRMSKSALNMATKNIAIELSRGQKKVVCVSLHPGTVDTDLSRPYHRNVPRDKLFTAEYSVHRMMGVIGDLSMEDSGKFLAWDGKEIPF